MTKANLRLLEERISFSRFRPYYLLCSEHTHSNFNGFKKYMSGNKIILPSLLHQEIEPNAFIDPMQFTVMILHEVNHYILFQFSDRNEFSVDYKFLRKIFEQMLKTFDDNKPKN